MQLGAMPFCVGEGVGGRVVVVVVWLVLGGKDVVLGPPPSTGLVLLEFVVD